jgi:hypothetical protein
MKLIPTVYELRKQGWKVKVGHHRLYFRYDPFSGKKITKILLQSQVGEETDTWYLAATGGKTTIYITTDKNENLYGESFCSDKEHYRRSTGIKKAIARALAVV